MNRKDFFKMMFGGIATAVLAPKLLAEAAHEVPDFIAPYIPYVPPPLTLAHEAVSDLVITLNGQVLLQGFDYGVGPDHTTIIFAEAPPKNSIIRINYLKPLRGDGWHDDTDAIQQRLDLFGQCALDEEKTYLINDCLHVKSPALPLKLNGLHYAPGTPAP